MKRREFLCTGIGAAFVALTVGKAAAYCWICFIAFVKVYPLAPLWVWLAFKETPGASTIIGVLIVFAVVCVHLIAGTLRRKTQLEPAVF